MKFNKILICQNNMLGDVVISTGIVRAIREQFPSSKLAFMVDPDTAELVDLPFIDEVIPYDKGMPLLPVIRKIWRYDVAILLDFKYRSAWIPFLACIPIRAGLAHKRNLFMTHGVERPADSEEMYFIYYMSKVINNAIGLKLTKDVTRLCVAEPTRTDLALVEDIMKHSPNKGINIAIAPFSSTNFKNWSVDRYDEFMQRLNDKYKCNFYILGGKGDIQKNIKNSGGVKLCDLRDKLKLTTTATLLRKMDYFIGSCSAPLHIAAAVGCPSMAFYGPTSPKKWAPLHKCKYIFHKHLYNPCDRIGYGKPCGGSNDCMNDIGVDEAVEVFEALMKEYPR